MCPMYMCPMFIPMCCSMFRGSLCLLQVTNVGSRVQEPTNTLRGRALAGPSRHHELTNLCLCVLCVCVDQTDLIDGPIKLP